MHIPDWLTVSGCIMLLLYYLGFHRTELPAAAAGAVIIFTVFYLVRKLTSNGLGFGDVKYSFLCGLYGAFPVIVFGCIISAVLGLCCYGLVALFNGTERIRRMRIPFAPFMSAGTLIAFFII